MHSIVLLLIATAFSTRVAAVPRRPVIQEGDDVFVTVENGDLRGVVATSLNGALYNQFLGIPYATPPVGDLRFRAPQPAASWSGVRDALSFADACAQPVFAGLPFTQGSDDCLYLNVYAPATTSGPLPVMVYIHGGAFKTGSSSGATPHYFVEKGVLLVSIAYRLGALGFLSLQNEDIPGNAGFKDQVLALQWVQRNIAAFGGDPSRVAIFGESAGGGSTSHLFLSPATKGLFSGVIMESGVATTPWGLTDIPRERAYRMAGALGFQTQSDNHTDDDDARLAAFLRAANYSDLIRDDSLALTDFEKRCPLPLAFLPVVEPPSDSAVIVEPPVDVLKAGSYNQVPIMLGVTSGEGAVVLMLSSLLTQAGIADMKENFTALVGSQLPLPTEEQRTRAAEQLEQFYFGDEGFSMGQMQAVIDLFSDLYFIHPADSFARAVANSSNLPIHFYYFGYNGTGSTDYGMVHAGELLYLFPSNSSGPITNPKSNDGKVASELATLWTNFPKYGDPAPSGSPVVWEKLTENASNYLDMELEFVTRQDLLKERMDFWRDILSS
ncbi:juvenile hormone esterase-like isoform X3 [Schistocerca nitens]|uniref:juvenile hormone esterase-like isoform X3 n=1 Tax=Schistocerca nitens TaxID=7011 RepID=UPI0021177AC6|nr:juvenile hormone esterase-like isoform X3 [Schistocerca nitens]